MNLDTFLWILGRVAGLSSFAALAIAVLTGIALRSALLDRLASNRALKTTHEFTSVLWIPLGILHIASLLLDGTARLQPWDAVVPFIAGAYDLPGRLAIGLGTLAFDLVLVVAISAWLRSRMNGTLWYWLHRLSYVAFALLFLHAVLSGTDFSDPVVSSITWSSAFALMVFSLARLLWGRLPAAR